MFGIVAVCLSAAPAMARSASPDATIRGYYAQISRLAERRDAASWTRYLAATFVIVGPDRKTVGRAEALSTAAKVYKSMSNIKDATQITRISHQGASVIVANTVTLRASLLGGQRPHSLAIRSKRVDVWKQYNGVWKMARRTLIGGSTSVDGVVRQGAGAKPRAGARKVPKPR